LNHLRKPKAVAQESMDMVPMVDAASTAEKVHNREEFRQLLQDVTKLPETQRAALLLREIDALSYEEIAEAMDTTVPSVKSLLVRARISLAEASQARMLTCGEVRVELAEAAEGLAKASGPVRRHVRDCEECSAFRKQLRNDNKALAAMMPIGFLAGLKGAIAAKLGLSGGAAGTGAAGTGAAGAGAGAASAAGAASTGAAISAGTAASGIGAVTSAVGAKALAGVVTAAVITAGAVEVKDKVSTNPIEGSSANSTKVIASSDPIKPVTTPANRTAALPADPELDKASAETPATDPVEAVTPDESTDTTTTVPEDHPAADDATMPTEPVTPANPATSDGGDGLEGHTTYPPDEIVNESPATVPSEGTTDPTTVDQVPGSAPTAPVVTDPSTPVVPTSPTPAPTTPTVPSTSQAAPVTGK
jgi:hypothetical protein